jgi:hypothetical protein
MLLSEPVRATIRELTTDRTYDVGEQRVALEHIASEMTPDGLWRLSHSSINGIPRGKKIELFQIDSRDGRIRKRLNELDRPAAYSVPTWYFEEVPAQSQKVAAWRQDVLTRQREAKLEREMTMERTRARRIEPLGIAV